MTRGGRRPGAGAPRGNFNAVRSGARSSRLRVVLAALLQDPETREVVRLLYHGGEKAHDELRDLLLASARLVYDRPVRDEARAIASQVAGEYVAKLGPVAARRAVRQYQRQLAFEDLLPPPLGRARRIKNDNPVFREFCRLLLGIDPDALPKGRTINSDDLAAAIHESDDRRFAAKIVTAITQSIAPPPTSRPAPAAESRNT